MNNGHGSDRRLLRATLLPAVAAVAILVTACSSSPSTSSSTGGSAYYQKALAYSKCMRSHQVPNFPDPNAQGNIIQPAGAEDDSNPVFAAADRTCRPLISGSGQTAKTKFNQILQQDLKLAQCMRTHGVPNFPDPQVPSPGSVAWSFDGVSLNVKSPQFLAAERSCQSLNNSPSFPGT